MSYDIHIMAINQTMPAHADFLSKIILCNEVEDEDPSRYLKIWPFFSNTKGIIYSLYAEDEDGFISSFPICDGDFEAEVPERLFPGWLPEEGRADLTPFVIKEEFYEEFIKAIHFLIETSPQKRIMFQTSFQCEDIETVLGVIKESQLFAMLDKEEILFNVCYIVEEV